MIVHQKTGKTEKSEIKKCILTIGEKTVPAVLEKETITYFGFDENCKELETEIICRKYFLDKEFPYFIDGVFDIIQDGNRKIRCYMSDSRKSLIEVI